MQIFFQLKYDNFKITKVFKHEHFNIDFDFLFSVNLFTVTENNSGNILNQPILSSKNLRICRNKIH